MIDITRTGSSMASPTAPTVPPGKYPPHFGDGNSSAAAVEAVDVQRRRPGVYQTWKASQAGSWTLNRNTAQRTLPWAASR